MGSVLSRLWTVVSVSPSSITISRTKYRSTFPVTRLTNLALLCVFKQLPLRDQMTASKVCTRWAALMPEAARRIRSLIIIFNASSIDDRAVYGSQLLHQLLNENGASLYPTRRLTEWNTLQFFGCQGEETLVHQIASTFTAITELQFTVYDPFYEVLIKYEHIITILGGWRHQLTTFKLYNIYYNQQLQLQVDLTSRLFAAINSLSALKSLTLDLQHIALHDLSILSQLEDITVHSSLQPQLFLKSLQRHIALDNTTLTRISVVFPINTIDQFASLPGHLRHRIIRLCSLQWDDYFPRFDPIRFPSRRLEFISTHFRSLTSLAIESPNSLRQLFTNLSRLTELLHLKLYINMFRIQADQLSHLLLPQVKSVKALDLHIRMRSHDDLTQLNLPLTVPNLEVIYIDISGECSICGSRKVRFGCSLEHFETHCKEFKQCLHQMFHPLKRNCSQLYQIQHNFQYIFSSAERLLAE